MIQSRIVRQSEAFLLEADGRRLPLYAYMSYQPSKACYPAFRQAGVRLFCVSVYAGDRGINPGSGIRPFRLGFWKAPGSFDFSAVEEDFRLAVGTAAPGEAFLLPRLMLELPSWWEDRHPQALCRDASGLPLHASFSAPEWLEAQAEAMEAFQAWLERSGWDRYVVGWHLAGGSTEEFIRPVLHGLQFTDYSLPAQRHFIAWLIERYGSAEALNAAWNTRYAGFSEVRLPTPVQRTYARWGELRDPAHEQACIDYYAFHSQALAQAILALCERAKAVTRGRQVMGAFYGYTVNVIHPENGHHALRMLLESDAVDFLASPFTYMDNRAQGVDWPAPGPIESARLHGKPWFLEADVRTHLTRPLRECMPYANPIANDRYDAPVWHGPDTPEGALGQMGKAFARILTQGTACWWFDMWGGWYDAPELMAFQARAAALYDQAAKAGETAPAGQVAVFLDETLYAALQPGGHAAIQVANDLLRQLGWMGAPYDLFLLSDLPNIAPGRYRMGIFPFALHWSPECTHALTAWKSEGRTLLFTGLPCHRADAALWSDAAHALTGIRLAGAGTPAPARFADDASPAALLPLPELLPGPQDVVLANLENGRPGLILHREPDHQTAWSLPLAVPQDFLHSLALLSGAHIYAHSGDTVYANARFIAIHAASGGVKRIWFPQKGTLQDAFTEAFLQGTEIFADFPMAFGETRLFRFHPH